MSTPTVNTHATQGIARVVTDLEHQVTDTPRYAGPPSLGEILGLAETMRMHAGDSLTPVLDKLWAASAAIDETLAEFDMRSAPVDLLDLSPEQVADRFREDAYAGASTMLDSVGFTSARRTWERFTDALARSASVALKSGADDVVKSLRKDFDKHLKVVATAAAAGLTQYTETTELLTTGTDQQIAAFRALPDAVAALEQIAGLRNQMTGVLRYGPAVHPVHSFVTNVTKVLDAESAANRYDGTTETVQYNAAVNASTLTQVHVQRLGGRWLALATLPGVTLRLNSADEVQAQYDGLA